MLTFNNYYSIIVTIILTIIVINFKGEYLCHIIAEIVTEAERQHALVAEEPVNSVTAALVIIATEQVKLSAEHAMVQA